MQEKIKKRRAVSDSEYEAALTDLNNVRIMKNVTHMFSEQLDEDTLYAIRLEALWRCLGYHINGKSKKPNGPPQKFTTNLTRFTLWECIRALKSEETHDKKLGGVTSIQNSPTLDIPEEELDPEIVNLRDCIASLSDESKDLITKYYYENMTMTEIGKANAYSKECARQKVNASLSELRELCINK